MRRTDHPFVRESWECPLCGARKAQGHVACETCFQEVWANGNEHQRIDAEEQLDEAEARHSSDTGQFGVGS